MLCVTCTMMFASPLEVIKHGDPKHSVVCLLLPKIALEETGANIHKSYIVQIHIRHIPTYLRTCIVCTAYLHTKFPPIRISNLPIERAWILHQWELTRSIPSEIWELSIVSFKPQTFEALIEELSLKMALNQTSA